MSTTPPCAGSQVGPYQLDKVYPESNPAQGVVYEAHHVEKGTPAFVFLPNESLSWVTRISWTIRTRCQDTPAYAAVEVANTPDALAETTYELKRLYQRMSAALAKIDGRRMPAFRIDRNRRTISFLISPIKLLSITALVSLLLGMGVMGVVWRMSSKVTSKSVLWSDTYDFPGAGMIVPSEPLKGQQTPPCAGSEEINGGCWAPLQAESPCPPGYAEYAGKCYLPVPKPPASPAP